MKAIYSFFVDCGRMGSLDGLFVAEKSKVKEVMGKHIYFGEALGKHSEISIDLDEEHLEIKTEDQDFIKKFEDIMGTGTISGFNPLDYYDPDQV